jgi:hypothetical protein
LAIASLILSIIWIGGLGSILAIIFGFVARANVRRSYGAETGGGLAIAGIVIGFVGIAGLTLLILLAVAVGNAANTLVQDLQPRTVAFGTSVNLSNGDAPGLQSMTVSSLSFPPASTVSGNSGSSAVVVARMTVCAGSSGSQDGFDALLTGVYFSDGESGNPDFSVNVSGLGPNLTASSGFAAGQCISGYVPYDVVKGTHPIGVEYTPGIFIGTVHWTS